MTRVSGTEIDKIRKTQFYGNELQYFVRKFVQKAVIRLEMHFLHGSETKKKRMEYLNQLFEG